MKGIKNIEKEDVALNYLGKAFVKVPRSMMERLDSAELVDRQMARLHLCLFGLCYHDDGFVMLNNRQVACRRGEYVGTQLRLAVMAEISLGSLRRVIGKMVRMQLISVSHIPGGSRISVKGYSAFTQVQEGKERPKDEPSADAAAQMLEAERSIGGRSMQNTTNPFN